MYVDDDSEPILGQWFEETLSPSESQTVDVPSPSSVSGDVDGVGSKHAHHHSSADSICVTADKKEPDTVRRLGCCSVLILPTSGLIYKRS